jgi:apolipoprotein N-acyltransferase
MSSAEQTRISMPSVLVVALTVVTVILLTTAVAFAPVALFAVVWGAPVGFVGIGVWIFVAIMTVLVMAGKSWARFGLIALPIAMGALAVASGGVGFFGLLLLGIALAITAVLLTFHSSSRAYFAAVAARTRTADVMASPPAS